MSDRIVVKGMEFYGYHGALKEEKVLGQKFIIDLEMYLDLEEAGINDDLSKTVNYAEVYEKTKIIVTEKRYNLIEAVAEDIANELKCYTGIKRLIVTVHKPKAPIKGIFSDVAVQIERTF